MKLPRTVLAFSLAMNLALMVALTLQQVRRDASDRSPGARASRPPTDTGNPRQTAGSGPEDGAATPALAHIDWTNLQPADFASLRERLAALGLPPDTVRFVTGILVMKHYEERRRALHRVPDASEFWRNPHVRPDPQMLAASRELDREGKKVLRELLGGDFSFDDDVYNERRRFGALSADKIAQLKKIDADYRDLEEQLFADGADRGSPESRARSALLAKEKRTDIERLLTADELADYDLRNSSGAHRLRNKFGQFEPTEAEFRALYPTFKALADAEPPAGPVRPINAAEFRRNRENAERQLDAEMRRVLGETRYAQWQEANDHGLQETRTLVASLNLPAAVAGDLIAIQKEIQPRLAELERNRDLTPNQRDAQLATLAADARTRITRLIGPSGFEAYKRRGGGWLGAALSRSAPQ